VKRWKSGKVKQGVDIVKKDAELQRAPAAQKKRRVLAT